MLTVKVDKQFKKDIKRDQKCGKYSEEDFVTLKKVMDDLIEENVLDDSYLEHQLMGEWRGYSECHLKPNWLLIYKTENTILKLARLGTHQQLFKKY